MVNDLNTIHTEAADKRGLLVLAALNEAERNKILSEPFPSDQFLETRECIPRSQRIWRNATHVFEKGYGCDNCVRRHWECRGIPGQLRGCATCQVLPMDGGCTLCSQIGIFPPPRGTDAVHGQKRKRQATELDPRNAAGERSDSDEDVYIPGVSRGGSIPGPAGTGVVRQLARFSDDGASDINDPENEHAVEDRVDPTNVWARLAKEKKTERSELRAKRDVLSKETRDCRNKLEQLDSLIPYLTKLAEIESTKDS